jgi:hypothetical protein
MPAFPDYLPRYPLETVAETPSPLPDGRILGLLAISWMIFGLYKVIPVVWTIIALIGAAGPVGYIAVGSYLVGFYLLLVYAEDRRDRMSR